MCSPELLAVGTMAATTGGQMMGARATNKASRKNAEAMARQARDNMGRELLARITQLQDNAREAFGQKKQEQEILGGIRATYAGTMGTPVNEAQRQAKNDGMDAEWALAKSMDITHLNTKDAVEQISLGAQSKMSSLPTVGMGQQLMGVVEAGMGAGASYMELENLRVDTLSKKR